MGTPRNSRSKTSYKKVDKHKEIKREESKRNNGTGSVANSKITA